MHENNQYINSKSNKIIIINVKPIISILPKFLIPGGIFLFESMEWTLYSGRNKLVHSG